MKTPTIIFFLLTLITSIHALTIPSYAETSRLFKRKGGGGGGGRGGGSSSGGRTSSSSSSSSSSSRGGSSSSNGGRTGGVGPQPRTYGSGAYYGGGAATPYRAGGRSPGGIVPFVFLGAGIGFLGAGAYHYPYGYQYYPYDTNWTYHNNSANENQTRPVSCYCNRYEDCACDDNNNQEYKDTIANNATIARVADVNGTDTLLINGTLPNDTAVAQENVAAGLRSGVGQMGGLVLISGAVAWGVALL